MFAPPSAKVNHIKRKHLVLQELFTVTRFDRPIAEQERCRVMTPDGADVWWVSYLLSQQLLDHLLHRHVHQLMQQNSHVLMVPVLRSTCRTSSWSFAHSASQLWTTGTWNPHQPALTEPFFSWLLWTARTLCCHSPLESRPMEGRPAGETHLSQTLWPLTCVWLRSL